jgi:hypothetical protein
MRYLPIVNWFARNGNNFSLEQISGKDGYFTKLQKLEVIGDPYLSNIQNGPILIH